MIYFLSLATNLSVSALAAVPQAQADGFSRGPLWIWILVSLLVVMFGVIWTLREEEALASALPRPHTTPEPVRAIEKADDLKEISGIGPQIAQALNERGITTFAQLADTEPAYLEALMQELEWGEINHPETWPAQARALLAAKKAGSQ